MSKNSLLTNTSRGRRIAKKVFRDILCSYHQPFVKMEKVPEFFGYRCPECGKEVSESMRLHRLKALGENSS